MCFARATAEHKCVYYTTMSEPHAKLVRHLEGFPFFDRQALGTRVEFIHLGDFLQPVRQDGLEPLISEIVRKTLDEQPAIVVIDSAKMLGDFADERDLRRALYDLTGRVAQSGAVLLLLGEYTPEEMRNDVASPGDGIVQLEYEAREPLDRRWLRIIKMRGEDHRSGKHTFRIGPGGVEVFPRIETLIPELEAPLSVQVSSGIAGLDELMGGGARRGDATVVTGPSGVGKTIFGLRRLAQSIEQGENALYVTFQDTGAQLTSVAAGFDWDLAAYQDSGQLVISYVPMGDLDLDAVATSVRAEGHPPPQKPDRHRQPVRAGVRCPRREALPRVHAQPRRASPGSGLNPSGHERDQYPRASRQLAGGIAVPVRQRHRPAVHRGGSTDRPGRARREDAQPGARYDAERRHHQPSWPRGLGGAEDVTGRLGWSALRTPA